MSDTFDPDTWPTGGGDESRAPVPTGGSRSVRRTDDDEYDALAFDETAAEPDAVVTRTERTAVGVHERDGDDDWDFGFDEEPTIGPRGGKGRSEREDYDSYDDENDRYDDEYDDEYDEFDREPKEKRGIARRVVAFLAVACLLGALAFGASALLGGDDEPAAQPPTEQPSDQPLDTTDTTAISGTDPALTPSPGAPSAGPGGETGTIQVAPPAVLEATDRALRAWGEFAVAGDLDIVRPYFAAEGKQFATFEAEAREIQARPPGGPPMSFVMRDAQTVSVNPNVWTIKGRVEVTREGEEPQNFPWEVRLERRSERDPWQVLTVGQY